MTPSKLIVLGITHDWEFAAGVVLIGLKRVANINDYDIMVFGPDEKDFEGLRKIKSDIIVKPFDIDLQQESRFHRVSKMTFSRLCCFDLLNTYETVCWLDTDILILKNISDIFTCASNGLAMYRHDNISMSVSFAKDVPGFNMNATCFNAGIFVINSLLPHHTKLTSWCLNAIKTYEEYINSDQAIFNMMLQQFNIIVDPLPEIYNCHPDKRNTDTKIVHAWGVYKFWNALQDPIWNDYYQEWLSIGGTPKVNS